MKKNYFGTSIKTWGPRVFLATIFSAFCSGCATASKVDPGNLYTDDLFIDPTKRVGERVAVRGVLHWRFEDRSLYPSEGEAHTDRRCLPILIRKRRKDLIEDAKELDGSTVEVSGTLIHAARPGMVSVTTCRQVGIEVDLIWFR
jgi:hypothetical protein